MNEGAERKRSERERDLKVSYIVLVHGQVFCMSERDRLRVRKCVREKGERENPIAGGNNYMM